MTKPPFDHTLKFSQPVPNRYPRAKTLLKEPSLSFVPRPAKRSSPLYRNPHPMHRHPHLRSQKQDHVGNSLGPGPAAGIRIRHGLAVLGRVNRARQDAIDVDAALFFHRHALGQAHHGVLGGAKSAHVSPTPQGRARRHVDNLASPLLQHIGDDGLAGDQDGAGV